MGRTSDDQSRLACVAVMLGSAPPMASTTDSRPTRRLVPAAGILAGACALLAGATCSRGGQPSAAQAAPQALPQAAPQPGPGPSEKQAPRSPPPPTLSAPTAN